MKTKLFLCAILFLSICSFATSKVLAGEPVPGAEVYVELEPDDEPIANVQTNNDGEFLFTIPPGKKIPEHGFFKITISPSKKPQGSTVKKLPEIEKQTLRIPYNLKDGPKFKFKLTMDEKLKTKSNRGGFAVSGRNNA